MPSEDNGEVADSSLLPPENNFQSRARRTSGVTLKSNKSNASVSTDDSVSLPPPPDGGWGWVVVAASFFAHMLADGSAYSFGVLYEELLDYFQESKAKTALLGSIYFSIPLITGPIAGALTDRYGCRAVTVAGGIVSSIGFISSSFANSIDMLCFTLGIVSGFGLSMIYVPAVVIVAFYFEKKRAFATGVAVAGTGIGTFIFAPLIKGLIREYGWKGSLLIIGGMFLNVIISGLVFRPLTYPKLEKKRKKYKENLEKFTKISSLGNLTPADTGYQSNDAQLAEMTRQIIVGDPSLSELDDLMAQPVSQSLINFPTFVQEELSSRYPHLLFDLEKEHKTLREVLLETGLFEQFCSYHSSLNTLTVSDTGNIASVSQQDVENRDNVSLGASAVCSVTVSEHSPHSCRLQRTQKKRNLKSLVNAPLRSTKKSPHHRGYTVQTVGRSTNYQLLPMYRKDVFYRGNLMRPGLLSKKHQAMSCPNITMRTRPNLSISEDSSDGDESMCFWRCKKAARTIKRDVRRMLHFGILKSITFMYFCLSSFLLYFSYDVPYIFIPDQAVNLKYKDGPASFLVSVIGITSTFGQVLLGWIGDLPHVNTIYLYSVLTTAAGVLTAIVPLLTTYWALAVYCGAFGFLISANYSLSTIILVDLLGMNKLTNAYGVVMFAEGFGNLFGPPIAGYIADVGTSGDEYRWAFVSSGIVIAISGFMLFAVPYLKRHDKVAQAWAEEMDSDSEISETDDGARNCNKNCNNHLHDWDSDFSDSGI